MNNILEINLIDDTSKIDVDFIDNTSNIDVSLTDYNDKEIRDDIEELNQTKVDKVEGKGLTTNDFTDTDKNKLDNLENYDDTEVKRLINTKQERLVSGTNIKTINNQSILGSGNITIEGGGGTVDTAMSDSSTNAVQNRVIKSYVDDIVGDIGTILDSINGEVIGG